MRSEYPIVRYRSAEPVDPESRGALGLFNTICSAAVELGLPTPRKTCNRWRDSGSESQMEPVTVSRLRQASCTSPDFACKPFFGALRVRVPDNADRLTHQSPSLKRRRRFNRKSRQQNPIDLIGIAARDGMTCVVTGYSSALAFGDSAATLR